VGERHRIVTIARSMLLVLFAVLLARQGTTAWHSNTVTNPQRLATNLLFAKNKNKNSDDLASFPHSDKLLSSSSSLLSSSSRRQVLQTALSTGAFVSSGLVPTLFLSPVPSMALVKGNAPPPKSSPPTSDKPKCTNVDDCQALAERKEQELRERAAAAAASEGDAIRKTKGGTRYRDIEEGTGAIVKEGDEVTLYYKVLKLGKRSYDGLSGEGTVIFSRGYGLEDDESTPGSKSFVTVVGGYNNIVALNEALVGMKVGGTRRLAVFPPKGWRKPNPSCDGGPGGSGAGGDVKTDYVVVPTAQLVAEEACFDTTKQPFPLTYAQQRRMAQRFDQSLIMEVQLVAAGPATAEF